jgi:hypothetical protein
MNIDRATAAQTTMKHRKPQSGTPVRVQRLVRRQRCGHCAHLKSEHIPNSLCWEEAYSYWEEVMLPVCIYCAATCGDEEDEMCQTCWNARLTPNVKVGDGGGL